MFQFRQEWINEVDSMHREMSRLLDHFAGTKPPMVRFSPTAWEPAIDLYETKDELVVIVELAGVKEGDFQVIIERNVFTIRGEREMMLPDSKAAVYHQMEISSGSFERSVALPEAVDVENAQASYENGLVEVILPKIKKEQTVMVEIKVR